MKLMVFVQKNVDVSGNHIDAAEVSIFTLLQQHHAWAAEGTMGATYQYATLPC